MNDGKWVVISKGYRGSSADKQGLQVEDHIEAVNGRVVSEAVEFIDALDSILRRK